MPRRVRIAVDAMGGDFAPGEVVKGAVEAAREDGVEVILVGHREVVDRELEKYDVDGLPIRCFHAEEHIPDGGNPVSAIREKKQASVLIAHRLVKDGWADGVIGAGNTGAFLVASTVVLGRVRGLERPAVGARFPFAPRTFCIDLGTNTNCTAEHLFQFAVIGSVYVQTVLGVARPTVAVLSNGTEEGKGNRVTKDAYRLIKESGLNFVGNVEGHDLFTGEVDVIVCDGFVGNVLVKFMEGFSQHLLRGLQDMLGPQQWAGIAHHPMIEHLHHMTDILGYDRGVVLGVDGVSIVCHGRSDATAIRRGIQVAQSVFEEGIVERVKHALAIELPRMKGDLVPA